MNISYNMLPPHSQEPMRMYVERGIPTGSFLERILCNDLVGAASRADDFNLYALHKYAKWLYNDAPNACWGDIEQVVKWIGHKGMEGFSENKDG